jgi:hypothetical protein
MSFGLQNGVIALTPTGRIDSRFLNGADGSGVQQSWVSGALPVMSSLFVGDTFSVDLISTGALIDPGSPSAELGSTPYPVRIPSRPGSASLGAFSRIHCSAR